MVRLYKGSGLPRLCIAGKAQPGESLLLAGPKA